MTILIDDLWSYFNSGNDRQTEPSDDWWSFLFVSLAGSGNVPREFWWTSYSVPSFSFARQ